MGTVVTPARCLRMVYSQSELMQQDIMCHMGWVHEGYKCSASTAKQAYKQSSDEQARHLAPGQLMKSKLKPVLITMLIDLA